MGVFIMKTIEELKEEYENSTGVRRARAAIELRNQGVDPDAPRTARPSSTATTTNRTSTKPVKPPVPPRPNVNRDRPLPSTPASTAESSKPPNGVSERIAALQAAHRSTTTQPSTRDNGRIGQVVRNTQVLAATTRAVTSGENIRQDVSTASAAATTITVNDRGLIAKVRRVLRRGGTHEEQDNTAQVIIEVINAMIRNNRSAHCHAVAHHDEGEWALIKQYIDPLRAQAEAPDEEFMEALRQLAKAVVHRRENKLRAVTFTSIQPASESSSEDASFRTSVTTSTSDNSDDSGSSRRRWAVRFPNGLGAKASKT